MEIEELHCLTGAKDLGADDALRCRISGFSATSSFTSGVHARQVIVHLKYRVESIRKRTARRM
jgi:hypothetical protein